MALPARGRARKWIVSSSVGAGANVVITLNGAGHQASVYQSDELRGQIVVAPSPQPTADDRLLSPAERGRAVDRPRLELIEDRRRLIRDRERLDLIGRRSVRRIG